MKIDPHELIKAFFPQKCYVHGIYYRYYCPLPHDCGVVFARVNKDGRIEIGIGSRQTCDGDRTITGVIHGVKVVLPKVLQIPDIDMMWYHYQNLATIIFQMYVRRRATFYKDKFLAQES